MSSRACAVCWLTKKKCDRKRPCSRCVAFGHKCRNRETSRHRGRAPYSKKACNACVSGKVRCGETRPCSRCVRLGIECDVPLPRADTVLTPYRAGGYLPTPSMENIYHKLHGFLGTLSPFTLTDLLCGPDMGFRSAVTGLCSVIPCFRKRDFLERIVSLAGLQVSQPRMIGFISNRVHAFLEPEQSSPIPDADISCNYDDFDTHEDIKVTMEYYMHKHKFTLFPTDNGRRPAVMVDGVCHGLIATLNSEAEQLTGYSSAEYQRYQNVITPDFSSFDDFPQVLRVFHRDDIHIVMQTGLLATLNPATEVPFEARLIHKNGYIIPSKLAYFATVKADGKLELFITIATPLP